MWSFEPREGAARLLSGAVYLAVVIGFLLLQEVGIRLQREEQREWWAGNGRDLLNLAGLAGLTGALRLVGLTTPGALLVGGTIALALFGSSVFVATQTRAAHPRAWAFAIGLAFALPVLLWPRAVVAAFAALTGALFPGAVRGP